ncbi:MAG: pyridoxamine 5'-phosphate oxidase [Ignavibacteria bacterium]|nr:pyridoxamine 5'-phosphate oxidase [Ignavibacteria bacterium]
MVEKDISSIRHDYGKFKLDEKTINKNPFEQFEIWFNQALEGDFADPNAFALSTVNGEGKPSSRILLLKGFDERGFVFYTNYESRKGQELQINPNAAMLFFWDKFERQVRIEGRIEKLTAEESNQYFQSRPYTSRLGAWASEQSKVLKSRFSLMRKVAMLMLKYPTNVPLPPHWGGYRLIPEQFEFWQGRPSRLHDRFRYALLPQGDWQIDRLYP